MIKLYQLTYFTRAVDLKNITAAARDLNVSQPSLSNAIQALENGLRIKLLDRSAKGVRPTLAGQKLYAHATAILKMITTAEQDVMGTGRALRGKVVMTLPGTLARHLAPALISHARERFPDISLEILYGLSSYALKLLDTQKVDFGIVPQMAPLNGLKTLPLYREPLYVIGVPDFFQKGRKTIRFEEMASLPFVLTTPGNDIRKRLEKIMVCKRVALNILYQQDNVEIIKNLVVEGAACSVLPPYMLDNAIFKKKLTARKIVSPLMTRSLVVAWPEDKPLTTAAQVILDFTIETIRHLNQQNVFTGRFLL